VFTSRPSAPTRLYERFCVVLYSIIADAFNFVIG
jgi:hypothetical protein